MRSPWWFGRGGNVRIFDRAVQAFEADCGSSKVSLRQYWDRLGSKQSPSILGALIKVELRRGFENGESPRVLDYLDEFSILGDDPDQVVSLVYEEFCLLQEHGGDPDSKAFCRDYEPWRDSIASQLAYHRELSRAVASEGPPVQFPKPGERFDKYQLTSLLGVGGVAQVYLATEDDLGGRQLAIKVSAFFGQEPSILAKLDHRNIVPILTVAESASGLRGICMPYRPGPTLEKVIRRIGRGDPPRVARLLAEAMRPEGDNPSVISHEEQRVGWDDFPVGGTYPEAVAWIGRALAQALSYLHGQGVCHRDIKPANILLAYREGPQLLDFNLAKVPNNSAGASAAQKGATIPYSAPEQLKAFLDPATWGDVNEAADLYSLGLVLRELLTGQPPDMPISQGSLGRDIQSLLDRRSIPAEPIREINPGVPPALETIIGKCLAFSPSDRYAGADQLEEDLGLFLERRPLLHAPNESKLERGVNWTYRNWNGVVATVLSMLILLAVLSISSKRGDTYLRDVTRAEADYDSGTVEGLNRAKVAFEQLYRDYPNTARTVLGLAMTLNKLDNNDPDTQKESKRTNYISNLFREAKSKPDAEEVFLQRVQQQPRSVALLLNLGIVLVDKDQITRARETLHRCLELDPEGFMTVAALAHLEIRDRQIETGVRYLSEAIRIDQKDGIRSKALYGFRVALLTNLVTLIDRDLEQVSSITSRSQANLRLDEMEFHLRELEEDLKEVSDSTERAGHDFNINYFSGCCSSIRGALASSSDNASPSKECFDQARIDFDSARKNLSHLGGIQPLLQRLNLQERKLGNRLALATQVP